MSATASKKLVQEFHAQMIGVYRSAKIECGYTATRFIQMVDKEGGLLAAKRLLASPNFSYGLEQLAVHRRLDISMENLVLQKPWCELFADEELEVAKKRLVALGFEFV